MKPSAKAFIAVLLLFVLVATFTGCGGNGAANLTVSITGLPAGGLAVVNVSGPAGYNRNLTESASLTGLKPGAYTVTAANAWADDVRYTPSEESQTINVTAGGKASAEVVYLAPKTPTGGELAWIYGGYNNAAWTHNGSQVLVLQDMRVLVLDAADGGETGHFRSVNTHTSLLKHIAASPKDERVALATRLRTIEIWNYGSGELLHELTGHDEAITTLAWSPDGNKIASADIDGVVKVWDADTGGLLASNDDHTGSVYDVSWSPDSRYLASSSSDKSVIVWDTSSDTVVQTLTASEELYSVDWAPSGNKLAAGTRGGDILVWNDYTTGTVSLTINDAHDDSIGELAWSPKDNGTLASGAEYEAKLWGGNGALLRTISHPGGNGASVTSLDWSPDGNHLLVLGRYKLLVWNTQNSSEDPEWSLLGGYFSTPAVSLDGQTIAVGSAPGVLLITASGGLKSFIYSEDLLYNLSWSPDGRRIAASTNRHLEILDPAGLEPLRALDTVHTNSIGAVAWSPAGDVIASGSYDETVKFWDPEGHWVRNTNPTSQHTGSVEAVSWSPSGRRLVSAGEGGQLNVWNAADGSLVWSATAPKDTYGRDQYYTGAAWSPGGGRVATALDALAFLIYEADSGETGEPVTDWGPYDDGHYNSVAWSPDGAFVALTGKNKYDPATGKNWDAVDVFDAASGELLFELKGSAYQFERVAWTPDGSGIVAETFVSLYYYRLSYH